MGLHLAQINIAVEKYTYDDSRFSGIADNLARVYDLAGSTPSEVVRTPLFSS